MKDKLKIGLWMYLNDGGVDVQVKLKQRLEDMGCCVYNNFDLRKSVVYDGKILTEDGLDLTSLDVLYHMNAEDRDYHQDSILQALELSGVVLVNPYKYYRLAKDKFYANWVLRKQGINTPPSVLIPCLFDLTFIEMLFKSWGSILLKPRCSFGGKGIIHFHNAEQFCDYYSIISEVYDDFYLEKFIDFADRDYRIEIIGNAVVGGYSRVKRHSFKTNVSAGAVLAANEINNEQSQLALSAVRALNLNISIVDMVRAKEGGELFVLEVNDSMGIFVEHCLRPKHRLSAEHLEISYCYDDLKLNLLATHLYNAAVERRGKFNG